MSPTILSALVIVTIASGFVILRPFSQRVRFAFDLAGFLAIGLLFFSKHLSPTFSGDGDVVDSDSLWLHAVAGVWWLLGARVAVSVLWFVLQRNRRSRQARLFFDLAAAGIYITATVIVLNSVLALPIRGLLATSGLMAIVLGLALQNSLADVFSGVAVDIESPFGVGDRILLGDKTEGKVVEINWRSIHVLTANDDVAIIPNSLVAKSQIVNRSLPTFRRAGSVDLSCPIRSASQHVVETLLQATWLCPAILRMPAPSVTITRVGSKRIFYMITFFASDTEHLGQTKSLLLQHAQRQLHYAGLLKAAANPEGRFVSFSPEELLADVTLFEHLDAGEVDGLASQLEAKFLAAKDRLFEEGTQSATLYIVASGIVEVTRKAPDGVMEILGNVGAGDYLGEISLLTGSSYAVTATAKTACRVYTLPHQAIAPLLSANPEMALSFEASARRGNEILHRDIAAQANGALDDHGHMLRRIYAFFK